MPDESDSQSGFDKFANNILKLSQGVTPIISAVRGGSDRELRAEQVYYNSLNGSGAPNSALFMRGTDVPTTSGDSDSTKIPPKWVLWVLGIGIIGFIVYRITR